MEFDCTEARHLFDEVCEQLPETWANAVRDAQREYEEAIHEGATRKKNATTTTVDQSSMCKENQIVSIPSPKYFVQPSPIPIPCVDNDTHCVDDETRQHVINATNKLSEQVEQLIGNFAVLDIKEKVPVHQLESNEQIAIEIPRLDELLRSYMKFSDIICPGTATLVSQSWQVVLKMLRYLMVNRTATSHTLQNMLRDLNCKLNKLGNESNAAGHTLSAAKRRVKDLETEVSILESVLRKLRYDTNSMKHSVEIIAKDVQASVDEVPVDPKSKYSKLEHVLCEDVSVTEALHVPSNQIEFALKWAETGKGVEDSLRLANKGGLDTDLASSALCTNSEKQVELDEDSDDNHNAIFRYTLGTKQSGDSSEETDSDDESDFDDENDNDDRSTNETDLRNLATSTQRRRGGQLFSMVNNNNRGNPQKSDMNDEEEHELVRNIGVISSDENRTMLSLLRNAVAMRHAAEKQAEWSWNLGKSDVSIQNNLDVLLQSTAQQFAGNAFGKGFMKPAQTGKRTKRRRQGGQVAKEYTIIHARLSKLRFQVPVGLARLFVTLLGIHDSDWINEWVTSNAMENNFGLTRTHKIINRINSAALAELDGNNKFVEFVYDFFIVNHGTLEEGENNFLQFLYNVHVHMNSTVQVHLFAQMCLLGNPQFETSEIDFYISILRELLSQADDELHNVELQDGTMWAPLRTTELLLRRKFQCSQPKVVDDLQVKLSRMATCVVSKEAKHHKHNVTDMSMICIADAAKLMLDQYVLEMNSATERLETMFIAADANNDGMLSFEEFSQFIHSIDQYISTYEITSIFRGASRVRVNNSDSEDDSSGSDSDESSNDEVVLDREAFVRVAKQHRLLERAFQNGVFCVE